MATSYTNSGGSGNRSGTPRLVQAAINTVISGTLSLALDGATSTNAFFFSNTTGTIIEFWFTSKKIIDEAKWYQQTTAAHGTWKWQGSNDRTTWTDIGGTFTLGGVATQTLTTLAGNTTGYIFYRLFQVSGTASSTPWIYEIEFKIDDAGGGSYLHPLGSGNRTSTITTAISGFTWGLGSAANLVNGSYANDVWWNGGAAAGCWVSFDLGALYLVQEARWWMGGSGSADEGTWKFQGSLDNSTWADLSGPFLLQTGSGVPPPVYIGGFASNATAYRYYRMLGVSGTRTSSPYELEVEFMVAAAAGVTAGRATQAVVETLSLPILPASRVTQAVTEILAGVVSSTAEGRVTQALVEILQASTGTRITQAVVELLQPVPITRVTQAVVELLTPSAAIPVRVTQLAVDVFSPVTVATAATQLAVEVFRARTPLARATQLVTEVFLVRGPCVPTGDLPIDSPPAGGSCAAGLLP